MVKPLSLSDIVRSYVLGAIGSEARSIDKSTVELQDGKILIFRSSKAYKYANVQDYFFGLPKRKFEAYPRGQLFVIFACGSTDELLVIPGTFLQDVFSDVAPSVDGAWKIHIYKLSDRYDLTVTGKPAEDVSDFHNALALITGSPKRPISGDLQKQIQRSSVSQKFLMYSISQLLDQYNDGRLILPPFQRGLVWTIEQQSQFIESLFLNIPIPPIILHRKKIEITGVQNLELIDGGQRLLSLVRFNQGDLSLRGLDQLAELNGMTFPMLPAELKKSFLSYDLQVIVFGEDLPPDMLLEAYTRFNRGSVPVRDLRVPIKQAARGLGKKQSISELVTTSQRIFPQSIVLGTRRYIEQIANQVNSTYEKGLYDACAVMIRRLLESLMIDCFEANGIQDNIRQNDGYLPFDKLVDSLLNEKRMHFEQGPRQSLRRLKEVKKIGDLGAHGRQVLITQHDIDQVKQDVRIAVEALVTVGRLESGSMLHRNAE